MIAIELLIATLFSSLVGSLHCVGMCTPFAILSMGPVGTKQSRSVIRLSSYHLGRLVTYLTMGTAVAVASSIANGLGGEGRSFPIVGMFVGLTMICLGISRLLAIYTRKSPVRHTLWSQRWTGIIVKLRKSYSGGPVWIGAFLWGLTSTFLPCGWLYLFVLAAAAAPSFAMTLAMMGAFWLGTLPLLSTVAWGAFSLPNSWQPFTQPFAAGCIISFGAFILVQTSMLGLNSGTAHRSNLAVHSKTLGAATDDKALTALEILKRGFDTSFPYCRGGR